MKYFRGLSGILKKTYNFKVVLEKLQSSRAVVHKGLKEEDMESYAKKLFNISDRTLSAVTDVIQEDGYYVKNGKMKRGISNETLVDKMMEGMDL